MNLMGPIGVPELVIVVVMVVFWLVPLAAAIWALVTLHRIQVGQRNLGAKLESIERVLSGRQAG